MPDIQPDPNTESTVTLPSHSLEDEARGTDALSHLARMSGTGSTFGAADYVAINAAAVASLILGLAGALSLIISLFLFLPLIGVGCGLLAIRQIRRSNGTQGGYGFAIAGIIVSLLIGGVVGTREAHGWMEVRNQSRDVASVINRFGNEIRGGNYDNAYDGMTTEEFRGRIDRAAFRRTFEELQNIPGYGPLVSMEWNGEPMLIEPLPDGQIRATCMTLIKCRDLKDPGREYFRVVNKDGAWKIASIPRLFPEKSLRTGFPR